MKLPHPGDRIRLVAMPDDPDPVAPGTTGTVRDILHISADVGPFIQIEVMWDDGRRLMLSVPPDCFEILGD